MPKELILSGVVQGVFCRYYCSQNAKKLGIRGSASNLRDGTVRVLLDSDDEDLIQEYAQALKDNPYNIRFYGKIQNITIRNFQGSITGDYQF